MPEEEHEHEASRWSDVVLAAAIIAVDPHGTGGISIRSADWRMRQSWLKLVRSLLPAHVPFLRLPLHITDDRIFGGLDLAATLNAGRPVAERGLLADANGGILVVPTAERLPIATAARIANVLDLEEVVLERDGLARRHTTEFGLILIDESVSDEEHPPLSLLDRVGIHLDLDSVQAGETAEVIPHEDIDRARNAYASVRVADDAIAALCEAAVALGVHSLNAPLLAVRVARIVAALGGRTAVTENDAAAAARLVIAPRASALPNAPESGTAETEPPTDSNETSTADTHNAQLQDLVVAAAAAAIPPGLLALLRAQAIRSRTSSPGRAGAIQRSSRRGRPAGVRRGSPSAGARLSIVETLRAAAPWQPLRRLSRLPQSSAARIEIRADDFRIRRLKHHAETTTIFVVDASGSTAVARLAEAKGAVELLLADCYIRRDQVALVAFSGRGAELLLPPTRSLTRAKRNLADLPGGGGTPLAAGIETAAAVADAVRRKGQTPGFVMLTDGRANISRDGRSGRAPAEEDALHAARSIAATGTGALVIDTAPQPRPEAQRIATALGATYIPLPHADAETLSHAVRMQSGRRSR